MKHLQYIIKLIEDENIEALSAVRDVVIKFNKWFHCLSRLAKNSTLITLLIDNNINLIFTNGALIHLICRYSKPNIIKHIIDKGSDLETNTSIGWRPIHFICKYSTSEMIKYIIDKGVNLEVESTTGVQPIHLIREYAQDMTKYIVDKGVETITNNG